MKRLAQFALTFAAVSVLLAGCSGAGGGGGGSVVPSWVTIFQDNFDRADTTGRDLGANWTIIGSGADQMCIASGQVHSSFATTGGPGVIAVYSGTIDYSRPVRASMRGMIVAGGGGSPKEFLGMEIHANGSTYAGYYACLTYDGTTLWFKLARTDGTTDLNPPAPAFADVTSSINHDVWYIIEVETSGTTVTARIKDATGTTLGTATLTDSTPTPVSGGSVVFYNCILDSAGNNMAGYSAEFDAFKIESYQ